MRRITLVLGLVVAGLVTDAPGADGAETHGAVSFPVDEHSHGDGLDYWWGAADVVTTEGNHYSESFAYTGFSAYAVAGHQLFAHQGPYEGLSVLSEFGPAEWGHTEHPAGSYVTTLSSYVPGVQELVRNATVRTSDGKVVDSFERTSLDAPTYRFSADHDRADLHPTDRTVQWRTRLDITMHDGPPLLAGGTGTWWYGVPETFGYPSRSFQYMQASRQVTGFVELEQPDGAVRREHVDASRSNFVMIHEYDASPEDIPAGFVATELTQLHPTYPQYYQGGIPWEILFVDLDNEAQLFLVLQAYHDTEQGTARPVIAPDHPTYRVFATLRLPTGESVVLDDELFVEHLAYRGITGRVPTAFVSFIGDWIQAWTWRVGHPGGSVAAGDGTTVRVPAFDLTLRPWLDSRQPALDSEGYALTQRLPISVSGQWNGCPSRGSGWSEVIVNWHGRTQFDPWFTGGDVTPVPGSCGDPTVDVSRGNGRPTRPTPAASAPFAPAEGCQAYDPGQPTCRYDAVSDGGITAFAGAPGQWTVTIRRPGRPEPIVVPGFSGHTQYQCGVIRPGDRVEVEVSAPNTFVTVGNGGLCTEGNEYRDGEVAILPGPGRDQVRTARATPAPAPAAAPERPTTGGGVGRTGPEPGSSTLPATGGAGMGLAPVLCALALAARAGARRSGARGVSLWAGRR